MIGSAIIAAIAPPSQLRRALTTSIRDDLAAEGKSVAEVEAALRSTDEAIATASSATDTSSIGNYWTAAPFDTEAT